MRRQKQWLKTVEHNLSDDYEEALSRGYDSTLIERLMWLSYERGKLMQWFETQRVRGLKEDGIRKSRK